MILNALIAYIIRFHGDSSGTVCLSYSASLRVQKALPRVAKKTTDNSSLNPVSLTTSVEIEHFSLNNYNKNHKEGFSML